GPLVLDEREESPEPDTRLRDFEIALDGRRYVEQERRERVREPRSRGGVAGNRRLRGTELKLAARAAEVLRLQQEVARVSEIFAELDRVIPLHLGEDRRDLHRPLAAIPRQAR